MLRFNRVVYSPEIEGAGADPSTSSGMEAILQTMLIPAEDSTKRKTQAVPTDDVAPKGATATDDTASNTDADAGADGDEGGTPDDEFDPFAADENTATDADQDDDDKSTTDDEKYTVTVDGQEVEVTLAELKRRYSGEGAIERRLQEATAARTEAQTMRAAVEAAKAEVETETQTARERLVHVLGAVKELIAKPTVRAPDPALAQTDPTKYLIAMEAYRADQAAVHTKAGVIDQIISEYEGQRETSRQELRQAEATKLAEALPALRDPVKAPKVKELILAGAKGVGFTPEEVSMASDHRLFIMAAKAAQYDKLMASKKGATPAATVTKTVPAGAARTTNPARSEAAKTARAFQVAKENPTVDNLAATLFVPKRRK